jgi:hypothetical protein
VREDNFLAVVFRWGFAKMWCKGMVFGWCERGFLLVKRGELTRVFLV